MFKSKPMIFNNKYLTKEQQLKRNFWKGAIVSFIFTILIILIYQFIVLPHVKNSTKLSVLQQIENQKKSYMKAYKLKSDVAQGQKIIDKDLDEVELPKSDLPTDYLVKKDDLKDKLTRLALTKNTIITNAMLTVDVNALTSDLRKQDYSCITLNKNLQKSNYVDIRFKKKDGSDYIVAAKKQIIDMNGTSIVVEITEMEREYLNNAIVYASITGATLYTTIYVDPQNQPTAAITYQPNADVTRLINNNPNIIKNAQQDIQNRNTQSTQTQASSQPNYIGN